MSLKMWEAATWVNVDLLKIWKAAASWIASWVVHSTNMWDQVWSLLNEEEYELSPMIGILGIIKEYEKE
jgi:hypothetical protein